jgi:hypothetical protein
MYLSTPTPIFCPIVERAPTQPLYTPLVHADKIINLKTALQRATQNRKTFCQQQKAIFQSKFIYQIYITATKLLYTYIPGVLKQ